MQLCTQSTEQKLGVQEEVCYRLVPFSFPFYHVKMMTPMFEEFYTQNML